MIEKIHQDIQKKQQKLQTDFGEITTKVKRLSFIYEKIKYY